MAYEGARGNTAKEMGEILGIPNNNRNVELAFKSMLNSLKGNSLFKLEVANAIWIKNGFKIKQSYKDIVMNYYNSTAQNVDLSSFQGTSLISKWILKKTHNKLNIEIKPDPLLRMIITNAIYFKGNWSIPFDESLTDLKDFYETPDKVIKVKMMTFSENPKLKYTETEKYQALDMPYNGSNISMLVILPKKGYNLNNLDLNGLNIFDLEKQMTKTKVEVYFPKFSFKTDYVLNQPLMNIGMKSAFNPSAADFSGINLNPRDRIYISEVIHKAYINVTEAGTEAAAVTAIVFRATAIPNIHQKPIPVFNANHPFVFYIIDHNTGTILFMGKVINPNAS